MSFALKLRLTGPPNNRGWGEWWNEGGEWWQKLVLALRPTWDNFWLIQKGRSSRLHGTPVPGSAVSIGFTPSVKKLTLGVLGE